MKTHHTTVLRIALTAIALTMLVFSGCDEAHLSGPDVAQTGSFNINSMMAEDGTGPIFIASGSIQDEGTVEGTGFQDLPSFTLRRVFKGEKGVIFMEVMARRNSTGYFVASGHFRVIEGTGIYEGLEADGDFQAILERQDVPVEHFNGWADFAR